MDEINFSVLLEFLYTKFAVTFVFCFIGVFMRELLKTTKKDKSMMLINIKRMVTSTVFSTFLMCACAVYVDLQFEMYAVISVICGLWGFNLIKLAVDGNFMVSFITKMFKKFTNPLIKNAAETFSEMNKEQEEKKNAEKIKDDNQTDEDKKQ